MIKINAEEVRQKVGLSQVEMAEKLGLSRRGYQSRIYEARPNWFLSEIIKLTELNDGTLDIGDYVLKITKK